MPPQHRLKNPPRSDRRTHILGPNARPCRRTAIARQAADDRFQRQVDPDGTLPPGIRAKMAENARNAYYKQLAEVRAGPPAPQWR